MYISYAKRSSCSLSLVSSSGINKSSKQDAALIRRNFTKMSQQAKVDTQNGLNGASANKSNGTVQQLGTSSNLELTVPHTRTRHVSGGVEEIVDPFCDSKNPKRISFHDVTSAAFLIKGGVERTPCPVSF